MLWRRLGLIALISPALALAVLGIVSGPPGLLVTVPVIAAVLAFILVTARGEQAGLPPAVGPSTGCRSGPGNAGAGSEAAGAARRRGGRAALLAAVVAAAAESVVAGLVVVAGPATAPILLLAAMGAAPWAWARLRPHLDQHDTPGRAIGDDRVATWARIEPNPATTEPPAQRRPAALSTRALCAAWQRSYFDLQHAADLRSRDELVALRRVYLDELAQRDPAGIERWLAADPRAAGADPHRHFAPTESARSRAAPPHPARDHPSRFRRNFGDPSDTPGQSRH